MVDVRQWICDVNSYMRSTIASSTHADIPAQRYNIRTERNSWKTPATSRYLERFQAQSVGVTLDFPEPRSCTGHVDPNQVSAKWFIQNDTIQPALGPEANIKVSGRYAGLPAANTPANQKCQHSDQNQKMHLPEATQQDSSLRHLVTQPLKTSQPPMTSTIPMPFRTASQARAKLKMQLLEDQRLLSQKMLALGQAHSQQKCKLLEVARNTSSKPVVSLPTGPTPSSFNNSDTPLLRDATNQNSSLHCTTSTTTSTKCCAPPQGNLVVQTHPRALSSNNECLTHLLETSDQISQSLRSIIKHGPDDPAANLYQLNSADQLRKENLRNDVIAEHARDDTYTLLSTSICLGLPKGTDLWFVNARSCQLLILCLCADHLHKNQHDFVSATARNHQRRRHQYEWTSKTRSASGIVCSLANRRTSLEEPSHRKHRQRGRREPMSSPIVGAINCKPVYEPVYRGGLLLAQIASTRTSFTPSWGTHTVATRLSELLTENVKYR